MTLLTALATAKKLDDLLTEQGVDTNYLISALWLALDEVPQAEWMPEQIQALEGFTWLIQGFPVEEE